MIPPGLAIAGGKVLGVALAVGAIFGVGYYQGRESVQQAWDAAVTRQAVQTAQDIIAAAEYTAQLEAKYQRQLIEQAAQVQIVEKEVVTYVQGPTKKCPVSPELERVHDTVSRLLDDAGDRMPSTPSAPGAPLELPEALITDAEVLQSYQHAVTELDALWDTYAALVQWVRGSYALQHEAANSWDGGMRYDNH